VKIPEMFPRPREVTQIDGALGVTGPVAAHRDPALEPQGYELIIDVDGARLTYADEAGRRYGESTLAQLRRDDGSLPGVHIVDWPDFAHRGYMLDVSRDRVPTRATFERLVERLAISRYNQLQLYVEHTFAHPDHETVWADASPITPGDLAWLDDRCVTAGIELVVNQNTFGHFERWLAHPEYRMRAECPDGFEIVPGVTLPPSVLAPTPANAAFALDLVRAQLACVTSRTVNVGCDETFELGHGVSAPRAAADGLAAVYAEHLHRIIDPLVADGAEVQFWGDVARTHPEILDTFPAGRCTPLVWNYDAPDVARPTLPPEVRDVLATIGVDPDAPTDFATVLEPFVAAGHPFWVVPGTSAWQSFIGRLPNARANLQDAAFAGRDAGATGYLVTDGGDQGHHQPPAVSLPPIAYGGALAWCAKANRDLDVAAVVDTHLVGDATGVFGTVLERVGRLCDATGVTAANASPLFQAVVPSMTSFASGEPDADAVAAVIDSLDAARGDLATARLGCDDGADLVEGVDVAIGLARHGARRLAARARGERIDAREAADDLVGLIDGYRKAWLAVSRPGGLEESAGRLNQLVDRHRAEAAAT
jgi:hypothetical protein